MRDKLKQYKNKIEIQMEKDREAARGYLKNGQTELVFYNAFLPFVLYLNNRFIQYNLK